jgi:hypothetical protein
LDGWDDLVFTHISARVPGPEHHFLINPYGMMFEEITASSLVKVDADGNALGNSPYAVNPAGPSGYAQETSAASQPKHCRGLFFSHLRSASALARLAVAGQRLVLPPKVATMMPPLSVTMRRDDLRKKFRRPSDLDEERQSTGIGTGHVSAPSRQTH